MSTLSFFPIFSLLFLHLPLIISSTFTPPDNYLINCGSSLPWTPPSDTRQFTGDDENPSLFDSPTRTIQLSTNSVNSVRIFTKPSKYSFSIKEKGAHFVRLHFNRFESSKFDLGSANFHVLANGYVLLHDFSALTMENVVIKEYILWVNDNKLEIMFSPSKRSNFAFVSAIEVVSAPKDLILDVAQLVGPTGVVNMGGISGFGFETMYRVNVGGPRVTPFNDSLWRSWENDGEFLEVDEGSRVVHFGGRIKYREGRASREVVPDNVCGSARVIDGGSSFGEGKKYLTWRFRVVDGFRHLVRTHFCDIGSVVLGSLYFNVYVNGRLAVENLDLSRITGSLASPYYADFVVEGENGIVTVSIGPSSMSSLTEVEALLNGVEVFKMSNSMDSLDGMVSPKLIMRRCRGGNGGFVVPLVAVVGLLVAASVILRKRLVAVRDSVAWSRLPVDVSEVSLKTTHQ